MKLLALNAAAATLLGVGPLAGGLTFRLADFLHGGDAALDDFIRACARTRQPIFAPVALRTPAGDSHPYRVEGLLYGQGGVGLAATVFLRVTPREAASAPLLAIDDRLRAFARTHRDAARHRPQRHRRVGNLVDPAAARRRHRVDHAAFCGRPDRAPRSRHARARPRQSRM